MDDTDESYAEFSAQVRVMHDAARGLPATPTPVQEQKLALYANPDVIPAYTANATSDVGSFRVERLLEDGDGADAKGAVGSGRPQDPAEAAQRAVREDLAA